MPQDLKFAIVGAGSRGQGFSDWLADQVAPGCVTAVADPIASRARRVAERHSIPASSQFEDWRALLSKPKWGDVLINSTMDREHAASAVQGMEVGYHMLLEKPMATSLKECVEIARQARKTGRIVSVCHSLRYHRTFEALRELVRSGVIGEVQSYDQLESVEHVHQSHSFVRGNWGNDSRSAFMLLTKCCHDVDIIADMIASECERVSSFGSLGFFRKENTPPGAPQRCLDGCPHEESCPYYAGKHYFGRGWSHSAGLGGLSRKEAIEALKTSPYGRCVFQADNDVVDHQVVAFEFEQGTTATLTMTAFTPGLGRLVRVFGSKGYIDSRIDDGIIDLWEFWKQDRHSTIDVGKDSGSHGGADGRVMRRLIQAVTENRPELVLTGPDESLRTHAIVFAAERSRRERRIVEVAEVLREAQG